MVTPPQVQNTVQDFLTHLGFSSSVGVNCSYNELEDSYQVLLESDTPALLIGYHGDTLAALQLLISLHLHSQTEQWLNLSLNVNDYRQRRETSLHSLADSAVDQVLATGLPHMLPPLPANERRIVHLHLSNHPKVSTSSQGVGRSRSVVISPKV